MYKIKVNNRFDFEVDHNAEGLVINGQSTTTDISWLNQTSLHIIKNFKSYNAEVVSFDEIAKTAEIKINNAIYSITAKDQFDILLDNMGLSGLTTAKISEIKAPMPGMVLKVFVNEGVEIKKGDNLFTLEAMKMENIIKAPADVTVKTVKIKPGDKVEKGQVLLLF